ncbi:MAG: acylphosphatase [Alphaproteobacteria bacterium]|nr:acylphosphatase [Alphaproteobacteria bacterium]
MEVFWRIKGRVQRVGFRRWAIAKALEIGGISGYIHNDESGDVLVCIDGSERCIYDFMQACFKGPFFARVDEIINAPEIKTLFPPIENGVFKKI